MKIEIKKSIKQVDFEKAIKLLEDRATNFIERGANELIWV